MVEGVSTVEGRKEVGESPKNPADPMERQFADSGAPVIDRKLGGHGGRALLEPALTQFAFDNGDNTWKENTAGQLTTNSYHGQNRLTKVLNPDGTISTYTYGGDGPRRSAQEPGKPVTTMVWDGSDYLQERN